VAITAIHGSHTLEITQKNGTPFWILKKITGSERAAVWSVILMYLSPTLFGISQIVNPDTPFWVFGFASMLSFFAMLEFRERRFVWLSGLFFGLTLASKYVGIIFFRFSC